MSADIYNKMTDQLCEKVSVELSKLGFSKTQASQLVREYRSMIRAGMSVARSPTWLAKNIKKIEKASGS